MYDSLIKDLVFKTYPLVHVICLVLCQSLQIYKRLSTLQHVAVTIDAWYPLHSSLGVPKAPSDKLSSANQVLHARRIPEDQAINLISPTDRKSQVSPGFARFVFGMYLINNLIFLSVSNS